MKIFSCIWVVFVLGLAGPVYGQKAARTYTGGNSGGYAGGWVTNGMAGPKMSTTYRGGIASGYTDGPEAFGVNITLPGQLCEGEEAEFVAEPASSGAGHYLYTWYKDGVAVGNTACYKITSVTPAHTGNYCCELTDERGTTVRSDTLPFTVTAIPRVSITSPAQSVVEVCYGVSLTLSGTSPVAGAELSWREAGGNDSLRQSSIQVTVTGEKHYIFSADMQGCRGEDTVKVMLRNAKVVLPYKLKTQEGRTLSVVARTAEGEILNPATGLEWSTEGTAATGSAVNPWKVEVEAALEKVYVTYTQNGCVTHDTAQILKGVGAVCFGGTGDGFSNTILNFGVKVSSSLNLCENADTAFMARLVCADDPAQYRPEWFRIKNGVTRKVGDNWRLPFFALGLEHVGRYFCRVTNTSGMTVVSDTIEMHVNPLPRIQIIDPASRDTLICQGDTLAVFATSSVDTATVRWAGTGIVGEANRLNIRVAPSAATKYTLTADNHGCKTTDTVKVRVNHPFVNIPTLINTTQGSPVVLTATDRSGQAINADSLGLEWRIMPDALVGVNVNPYTIAAVDRKMTVQVTLHSGACTATDSVQIRMKGAGAFHGGIQDGFSGTCLPPVILVQPDAGERQCVTEVQSLALEVIAEGTDVAYRWEKWDDREYQFKPFVPSHPGVVGEKTALLEFRQPKDSDNGRYRCVLNGQCGDEVISDTCLVSVKGEPVILSGINVDRDQCAGSGHFEFNVIAENSVGNGVLRYRWYKNDMDHRIPEADTNFYYLNIGPTGEEEGLYIVEVSNDCGSVYDSAYLPVIVPPVIMEQSKDVRVCYGGSAEFWVKTNRDEKYHFALYKLHDYSDLTPEIKVGESFTNKITLENITAGGFYEMQVFHTSCDGEATRSAPIALHVEYPVSVADEPADTLICEGASLQLEVKGESVGMEPLVYQWYKDGVAIGDTSSSGLLSLRNVAYEREVVYYQCVVGNTCNEVKSRNIAVRVKRSPQVSFGPEVLPEYCEGDTLRMAVVLKTPVNEADSFRWYYRGLPLQDVAGKIHGSDTLVLQIDSLTSQWGEGYYYLEAYNGCGTGRSKQSGFTVLEPARFVKDLEGIRLVLCEGDQQTLGVKATGSPQIRYIWTQNGRVIADGYSNTLVVDASQIDKTETFTCHIQNMCSKGGEVTTAYVTASRPRVFDFEGGGNFCERDAKGRDACLWGSDTTVRYYLYREPKVLEASRDGKEVVPAGGPLCFKGLTRAGTYYVVAEDTNGCTATMRGRAVIVEDPLPEDFGVEIRKHLCENTSFAEVRLPGSETGVEYYLCKLNRSRWDTLSDPWPMAGTGAPIDFTIGEGEYKVVARNESTGCMRDLSPALNIFRRPLPPACELEFAGQDSIYCRGTVSDVRLNQACFQAGSSYRLQKDGRDYGTQKDAAPVYWTGLEEGTYRVVATNNWGCSAVYGHKVVISRDAPSRYGLIGQRYYCQEDTDSTWLELSGSQMGVRYSFRYGNNRVYKDTMGTGGSLFLRIPLTERDYYVIATDTTPEGCSVPMYDTIPLRKSRLAVNAVSPVTVGYNDSVQLKLQVNGAAGNVSYLWKPQNLLKPGRDTVKSPYTESMKESAVFSVKVTDGSGCPKTADVVVTVLGGDLTGGIRDAGGKKIDTLRLCGNEKADLMAVISGGGCRGNYEYSWSNEAGKVEGDVKLEGYSRQQDGFLYLSVKCGEETVKDTVLVWVDDAPPVDTVVNPGLRCLSPGDPLVIELKNSHSDAYYYLEYSPDRESWTDLMSQTGSGGAISFHPASSSTPYNGYFRVRAEMPHKHVDGGSCSQIMAGTVEARPAPQKFPVSPGWTYCEGELLYDTIYLCGSESNLKYQLKHTVSGLIRELEGNGDTLKFGGVEKAGQYVITVTSGKCTVVMGDTVKITENPRPRIGTLKGAGSYCDSECPVTMAITKAEEGIKYTLFSSNAAFVPVVRFKNGSEDLLTFGENFCDTGFYRIKAENPVTGCTAVYDSVVIGAAPQQVIISGGGAYCSGDTVQRRPVCIAGGDVNVTYRLYSVRDKNTSLGTFVRAPGGLLCDSVQLPGGKYVVVGSVGECRLQMDDTVHVLENPLPAIGTLLGNGSYCTSQCPLSIGISAAEKGVKYTLVSTDPGFLPVTRLGEDTLWFGTNFCDTGTYRVQALNEVTGCRAEYGTVVLTYAPREVTVTGGGTYCADSSYLRTKVCIASPERGVSYRLHKAGSKGTVGSFQWEADSSLCNTVLLTEGKYVVTGSIGGCSRDMKDTVRVEKKKIYNASGEVRLALQGNGCADSTVVFYIEDAPSPYVYQLYHADTVVGTPLTGSGARLEWVMPAVVSGEWKVKTLMDGCGVELDTVIRILPAPVLPALKGDSLYCEGSAVTLSVDSAVYDGKYSLFNWPADTCVKAGQLNGSKAEFKDVKAGTYYVRAVRGYCSVKNGLFPIREKAKPGLPVYTSDDCIVDGEGKIRLSGMDASAVYTISGPADRLIEKYTGDSLLSQLPAGVYVLQVTDTLSGCKSETVKDTLREGVPHDTLVPPYDYCDGETGVKLSLSNVHMDVEYSILTPSGSVLETIKRPVKTFKRSYTAGQYIFRRKRTGFAGGCVEEQLFEVNKRALPRKNIPVQVNGGTPLCEGFDYQIELSGTQAGVRYVLQKISPSVAIDTLMGTGADAAFGKSVREAAVYNIVAIDTLLGCRSVLAKTVTLSALPKITAEGCEYCVPVDDPDGGEGCGVKLTGMEKNVSYRLETYDTLTGVGSKTFKFRLAGDYRVIAEYLTTGCSDTVTVRITAQSEPVKYALLGGCYAKDDTFALLTTGSSADMEYRLYCNGVKVDTRTGDGNSLNFGRPATTGIYKVWVQSPNGCGLYLDDSVVVCQPLQLFEAESAGSFCEGNLSTGVEVRLKNTVTGWKYYVTNGYLRSDTLDGRNGTLAWNKLKPGDLPVVNGEYEFHALNVCGEDIPMGTLTVEGKVPPRIFPVTGKPEYYCAPEEFPIVLAGSEEGMDYRVKYYNSSGYLLKTYPAVRGTGEAGPLLLGKFNLPGIYEVVADSVCPVRIDRWEVKNGHLPSLYELQGADVCHLSDQDTLHVSVSGRENNVSYYLWRNAGADSVVVDSLTPVYRPAPERKFGPQTTEGCYYVVAQNVITGCEREMEGRLCLNGEPLKFHTEPLQLPGDTLVVCRDADTAVWLSGSEAGMGYELQLNGVRVATATGTGERLRIGNITESGVYRVSAYVCGVMMEDSVVVKVRELPLFEVDPEIRYCQGGDNRLCLNGLTDPAVRYVCYLRDSSYFSEDYGRADSSEFCFTTPVDSGGYYRIQAIDAYGCVRTDSTKVIVEPYPNGYEITSGSGHYICRGSYVKLGLSGSEEGVEYSLHRYSPAEEITSLSGTGAALTFPKQLKTPGTYYVTATYRHGLNCSVDYGYYPLYLADTLLPFEVEPVVSSYCITSPSPQGSIRLSGSQTGKEYLLMRDGVLMEESLQNGTGGILTWTGLEGKPCEEVGEVEGYIYRVVARDPVSGCLRNMFGADTIVAASPIEMAAREPNDTEVDKCEGTEMKFSVTASGCRQTYRWLRNGLTLKYGKEAYYNIAALRPSDYGTYECDITNACGTVTTPAVNLKVRELVKLEEPMPDEYVCDAVTKTVMFSSGFRNAETYTWYKLPAGDTVIGRRDFYEISDVQPEDAGTYVCVANNRCEVEVRDTAILDFGGIPSLSIRKPRQDTLCFGASFSAPRVTASVPLEWYRNGVKLDYTGPQYVQSYVTHADEGSYSVEAINGCGTARLFVASLVVDDTLKVAGYSGEELIRCPKDGALELNIDIRPVDSRVEYLWQDENLNALGRSNKLMVGPFEINSVHTYRVWFLNRCSSGPGNFRDMTIRVPDSIEVADPLRDVTLCADCMTDTVLRLGIHKTMMIEFEWYYRQSKQEETKGKLLSTADTVAITACTRNSGYYYCHYFNRCETKTTETSWVKIDSVPVVQHTLTDDTICEGMPYRKELTSTGGSLTYQWRAVLKDGTEIPLQKDVQEAFLSSSELLINNIGMEYDSCRISCYVENSCGKDTSDSFMLRVFPKLKVSLSPSDTAICKGDTVGLQLTLEKGLAPWSYRYRLPDGTEAEVENVEDTTDMIRAGQSGKYTLLFVKDSNGCSVTEGLPLSEVKYNTAADLMMSGSQSLCLDDTVSLRFSVNGGVGPWKIQVVDMESGELAEEICGTEALVMEGRDTVIRFAGAHSSEYRLNTAIDEGTGCHLVLQDSAVKVTVNIPDHIEFTPGPWHVGQCRTVDLRKFLKPQLGDGSSLSEDTGSFYINNQKRGSSLWLQQELRGDSCYSVRCEYADSAGCRVTSDEIWICVDSLPSGVVVSSDFACESVVNYFELQLRPAGRIDSVVIRQARYKKWDSIVNPVVKPKYTTIAYPKAQIPSGGLVQVPLNWDEVGGVDSCMTFEVLDIFDIHGCRMNHNISVREYDSLYRDTVWRHWDPVVDVAVRRSANRPWDRGVHEVNLPQGDSVEVKVTLVKGMPLWSLPALGVDSIASMDTVFWLKREGIYYFKPRDLACGRQSTLPAYDLTVTQLDTGYFRGRLLLEGPYDKENNRMHLGICNTVNLEDSLNLPTHLPLLPSHLDVIDWVEVELRVGSNTDSVALMSDSSFLLTRDTCLLLSDGHLADRRTGDTIVGIRNAYGSGSNRRYVAVRHRNHLGVMTARTYPFVKKTNRAAATFIDFTDTLNIYHKATVDGRPNLMTYHMTKLQKNGKLLWLLSAGELNTNYLVTMQDPNRVTWKDMHPTAETHVIEAVRYDLLHDINLDGCVDWPGWNGTALTDWLFVQRNRQKYTEVRWK